MILVSRNNNLKTQRWQETKTSRHNSGKKQLPQDFLMKCKKQQPQELFKENALEGPQEGGPQGPLPTAGARKRGAKRPEFLVHYTSH